MAMSAGENRPFNLFPSGIKRSSSHVTFSIPVVDKIADNGTTKTIDISTKETNISKSNDSSFLNFLYSLNDHLFNYACTYYLASVIATRVLQLLEYSNYLYDYLNPIVPSFLHITLALRLMKQITEFLTALNSPENCYDDLAMTALSILATALVFSSSFLAFPVIATYIISNFSRKAYKLQSSKTEKAKIQSDMQDYVNEDYLEEPSSLKLHLQLYKLNLIELKHERGWTELQLESFNMLCFIVMSVPSAEFKLIGQMLLLAYASLEFYYRSSIQSQYTQETKRINEAFIINANIALERDLKEGKITEDNEDLLRQYGEILCRLERDSDFSFTSSDDAAPDPLPHEPLYSPK